MHRIVDIRLVSAFWFTQEARIALNCKSPIRLNFLNHLLFYRNDIKRFISPGRSNADDDIMSDDYGSEDAKQI